MVIYALNSLYFYEVSAGCMKDILSVKLPPICNSNPYVGVYTLQSTLHSQF